METDLILAEEVKNPLELFKPDSVNGILSAIRTRAEGELKAANLETVAGRKIYASVAYKVAKSKTFLDSAGKTLVADWKKQAKAVDDARKQIRDELDKLKAEVRQPLTDWEAAEAEKAAREKAEAERQEAWAEAITENEWFDRKREIERKEAEIARIEAERQAKEEAERQAKAEAERKAREEAERIEREKRIAEAAAERAKAEADAAIRREQEARIAAELKAKANTEDAERRAREAAEEAKRKAEEEKAEAIRQERERQEAEARAKAEAERQAKEEAERKAADLEHRARINREALEALEANGIDSETGKQIIRLIASGKIANIKIEY